MAKDKEADKKDEKKDSQFAQQAAPSEPAAEEKPSIVDKVKDKLDDLADQLHVPKEPLKAMGLAPSDAKDGQGKDGDATLKGVDKKVAAQDANHAGDGQQSHRSDPARDTTEAILSQQRLASGAADKVANAAKQGKAPIGTDQKKK